MMISFSQPVCRVPSSIIPVSYVGSSYFLQNLPRDPFRVGKDFYLTEKTRLGGCKRKKRVVCGAGLIFPVDPWAPNIDSQSIASQLFAFSLFPYIGFLYYITKSKSAPKLTLFGFYFLLAFVGATIPAGIYAKVHYGTSLSNVDWLHGGAESLLTLTNLFIVMGLRQALANENAPKKSSSDPVSEIKEENKPSV
ncbi:hypothetical protein OIU77_026989 [Salix suchowensis]|uniref:Uncharacterized protein n=1 Tax=Salix suchowensis TaxID=1278906 RepID=A0ABQ9BR91_9ROSI|nr:1-acyl-sn-glycerol-3-phosphate acyltransferase delta [Salix suchowensis]KAJ6388534.1 hypothetical protein OIU77_026989 [Salix suchowensis]